MQLGDNYCTKYSCNVTPAFCAKRHHLSNTDKDKSFLFSECINCKQGQKALETNPQAAPDPTANRRRWMKQTKRKFKAKECDTCHEMFDPEGSRQLTCRTCKPKKGALPEAVHLPPPHIGIRETPGPEPEIPHSVGYQEGRPQGLNCRCEMVDMPAEPEDIEPTDVTTPGTDVAVLGTGSTHRMNDAVRKLLRLQQRMDVYATEIFRTGQIDPTKLIEIKSAVTQILIETMEEQTGGKR